MVLLHGTLDVAILEGKNLQVAFYGCMPQLRSGCRACVQETCTSSSSGAGSEETNHRTRSCYVVLNAGPARLAATRMVRHHDAHPVWNERFIVYLAHAVDSLTFEAKDDGAVGAEKLGRADVSADVITGGEAFEGWLPLLDKKGRPVRGVAEIRVRLEFVSVDRDEAYRRGPGPVPHSYFPMRRGCRVTAYQDAHVPPGLLPPIPCPDTHTVRNADTSPSAWGDIYTAVRNAKHLIYIATWQLTHTSRALPPAENAAEKPLEGPTIGELLKQKAEEGVRVNIILWDVVSSKLKRNPLAATKAVDLTHNGAAVDYFKDSKVVCVLAPRDPANMSSIWGALARRIGFTLHHKIFLADGVGSGHVADGPAKGHVADGEMRRLLAFIGGLDPTDHDYDTPAHSLNSWRKDKYEPWHDAECCIDGPPAWDVFTHFEQEWRELAKDHVNALLPISEMRGLAHPPGWRFDKPHWSENTCPELAAADESDPATWHVQVFRSADSASHAGLPEDPEEDFKCGLFREKGVVVDRSIQNAYVHTIRRARRFLYIENQYFVGSSYAWPRYKTASANNTVPMEIALKVAQKIDGGERFAAYVLVPLHPEIYGPQADAMLYWQRLTMAAMYRVVAEALSRNGLTGKQHPRDYLNFYCLGNRQDTVGPDGGPAEQPTKHGRRKPRRSFIHVHAKIMIQDDETLNIGSANLNERSLEGGRDTEIAMGAFQPRATMQTLQTPGGVRTPRGDVYGYRLSLWAEHFGARLDPRFDDPGRLECVRYFNELAESNWRKYAEEEVANMEGHIMAYPIQVGADGTVEDLPGWKKFPGEKGKVKGSTRGPAWFSEFTS